MSTCADRVSELLVLFQGLRKTSLKEQVKIRQCGPSRGLELPAVCTYKFVCVCVLASSARFWEGVYMYLVATVITLRSCPAAMPSTPSKCPASGRVPTKQKGDTLATLSPKRKRTTHDTPTRWTLAGMHPGERSPAVVLSCVMGANLVHVVLIYRYSTYMYICTCRACMYMYMYL